MSVLDVVCLDESTSELKVPGASDVYNFPRPIRTVGTFESTLTDSGGPVAAHTFSTTTTLANAGSKIASFKNNTEEKAYFDKDGWIVGGPLARLDFGIVNFLLVTEEVIFIGGARWGIGADLSAGFDDVANIAYLRGNGASSNPLEIGGAVHDFAFSGQHVVANVVVSGDHSASGATGTSQHGGVLIVKGGDGAVNGNGGDVVIHGGGKAGSGTAGTVQIRGLPTSATGLPAGTLWNNAGTPAIA